MKVIRISKGGQVSIPAEIRRRWATDALLLDDEGERLVIRPIAADAAEAIRGFLRGPGHSSDKVRAQQRQDERKRERSTR